MERPLNISPEVWAKMQQRRGSLGQVKTAGPAADAPEDSGTPVVRMDQAIDGLVANTKKLVDAIAAAKEAGGLKREEVMALDAIQDLVDTAIAPYLADVIQEMDVFEGVEV